MAIINSNTVCVRCFPFTCCMGTACTTSVQYFTTYTTSANFSRDFEESARQAQAQRESEERHRRFRSGVAKTGRHEPLKLAMRRFDSGPRCQLRQPPGRFAFYQGDF